MNIIHQSALKQWHNTSLNLLLFFCFYFSFKKCYIISTKTCPTSKFLSLFRYGGYPVAMNSYHPQVSMLWESVKLKSCYGQGKSRWGGHCSVRCKLQKIFSVSWRIHSLVKRWCLKYSFLTNYTFFIYTSLYNKGCEAFSKFTSC